MAIIDKFVVLMYDRTSNTAEVNIQLFSKKDESLESIPPTQDALKLHAKRAINQVSFGWNQALIPMSPDTISRRMGLETHNRRF